MVQERKAAKRKQPMTLEEKLAFNKRLENDPAFQAMMKQAREESARGEGITLSELKRINGWS